MIAAIKPPRPRPRSTLALPNGTAGGKDGTPAGRVEHVGAEFLLRGLARDGAGLAAVVALLHRVEHRRIARPVDILAGALLHLELALLPDHLAGGDRDRVDAGHGHAFEDVEVDLLVV